MSLVELEKEINQIRSPFFSQDDFLTDLKYQVGQLKYFYNTVVNSQTGDPSTSFYIPKKLPKPHQLAYVNLTRGFPKEVYGGHWCYVVKRLKSKLLVVPTTSVKSVDNEVDPTFQLDIDVSGFNNDRKTRLQLSDIRAVDVQRVYVGKGYLDVLTDRVEILDKIYDFIE